MHITFKTVALLLAVAAILAYCGNSQYQITLGKKNVKPKANAILKLWLSPFINWLRFIMRKLDGQRSL